MSNLCIIPARGGSKSVPRKNLRRVGGKPLIVWSIEQARAAKLVDRIVVSTDDPEIADVARSAGAEVPFLRPAELATDTAPTEPALLHALDWLEQHGYVPAAVLLLQPTCPVRRAGAIDRALTLFTARAADSLVAVREIHPFLWQGAETPRAFYDFRNRPRRQDVGESDRLFEETGSIYVTRTALLRQSGNRLGGKIALFEMDADESFDIDTEADVAVVNSLLSGNTAT